MKLASAPLAINLKTPSFHLWLVKEANKWTNISNVSSNSKTPGKCVKLMLIIEIFCKPKHNTEIQHTNTSYPL